MNTFTIELWLPSAPNNEANEGVLNAIRTANTSGGDIKINFRAEEYSQDKKIVQGKDAIAAIAYHEGFCDVYLKNGFNYSVVAMMGGDLPDLPFFRWGFSARTTAFLIGQYVKTEILKETRNGASRVKVLLVTAHPFLSSIFCSELKRGYGDIQGDDIQEINALDPAFNVIDPANGKERYVNVVENAIKFDGQIFVVVYGYKDAYDAVINMLLKKARRRSNVQIITESNYTEYFEKNKYNDFRRDDLDGGNFLCITSKLDYSLDVFSLFAKEAVGLCYDAVKSIVQLGITDISKQREHFKEFLVSCRFYPTKRLGAISFREDGEMFLPLYLYDERLRRRENLQIQEGLFYSHEVNATEILLAQLSQVSKVLDALKFKNSLRLFVQDDALRAFAEALKKIGAAIANATALPFFDMAFFVSGGERFANFSELKWSRKFANLAELKWDGKNVSVGVIACQRNDDAFILAMIRKFGLNDVPVVQINLDCKYEDLEDNGTVRIYLESRKSGLVLLSKWVDMLKGNGINIAEEAAVLSEIRDDDVSLILAPSFSIASKAHDCTAAMGGASGMFALKKDEDKSGFARFIAKWFSVSTSQKFLYCVTWQEDRKGEAASGGVTFYSGSKLTLRELQILVNIVSDVFAYVYGVSRTHELKISNTRSAIGSIMSRNGSHNIGSHVLAALSHNVGTMPDDRVLYQYIQHRMDYIATATTDFPIWSQPLPLVGNVIKNFLIQRHLLDHITGSEGLHAYQFQNDKVPTSAKENSDSKTVCQPKTIRIHARRIKDDMNWNELTHFKVEEKDFIDFIPYPTGDYEDESCKESLLSNDVEVAIPGGVVGRHAFYTIVENVLRNAAKHEWSKLEDENRKSAEAAQEAAKAAQDRAESVQEAVETAQAGAESAAAAVATETVQAQSCLELFVDFKDNPSKGIVEIVIWTDSEYSMQHYAMEQFKNPNGLDRARIEKRLATETGSGTLNLDGLEEHQRLQVKMARSFIAEDGQLRKENWGLAEMRISAGYLNVADIADIGGISTSDLRFELIKPVMIQNGEHYCLGYHFDLPKPKELLIVVPESAGVDEKTMRDAHAMLMQYGVGVMSENDVFEESCKKENSAKLSYAYILLKDFKKKDGAISDVVDKDDMRTWKLPFRVVTESKTELNPEDNKSVDRRADYVFSDNKNVFDSTSQKLYALTTSKEETKSFATAVLSDVYRSWVQHLKREHYNDNPDAEIILAIDVNREAVNDQGGKKGGKDLVSDADLLKVLFEICFDKAMDSFIQIWETNVNKRCQDKENGDACCQGEDIDVRLKVTLEQMKKMCPREVAIEPSRVIPESDTDGGEKESTIVFTTRQLLRQQLIKWCACIDSDNVPNDVRYSVRYVWEDLCDENENSKNKSDIVGLDAFLDYLEYSVLPQTKVFLSMYEECFVTLPKSITVAKEISEGTTIAALDNQKIEAAITEDEKKELLKYDERLIAYWRHENFETERDCRYLEPLSGAQSYLAAFECLKEESIERTRFVTKLIENGLVRILIIDERAKKFSDEHSEVKKVFDHIGIAVLDDKCPQVESIFSGEGNLDDVVGGEKVCAYDVLVIHQGIIDKKLKDHGNADKIREFIEGLKRKIRYVVVTTGRGSPANIPPEVRVLPFSVIESTLFRKYPEKMILVDAIMNTLPLARKERS